MPTYVGEFLLGRYCATTDPDEIAAGLEMVQRSMQERTVRAGEEELFKHRAREKGRVKIIDLLRARLDSRSDSYKAELPSLQLNDIHISAELVDEHQRMLTGGFYAEVTLEYIAALAQQQGGQPFRVEAIRPIQMSTHDALGEFVVGSQALHVGAVARSAAAQRRLRPRALHPAGAGHPAAADGPVRGQQLQRRRARTRGTGKSHLFQQVSPYAHLVSGGKATIANMFVNMNTGRRGLVAQYDVICFDEVSGVSFDQKEGVNILKGYMESGEFSRGKESIRADGGIVMVGNFDVDVWHQLRTGHLLGPLPKEMRDDTAFMDRIHAYIPGWDVPKLDPCYFTDHFGFVSDFLAEVWSQLRRTSRLDVLQGRLEWGSQLAAVTARPPTTPSTGSCGCSTPTPRWMCPDEFLAWAATIALELRRRVKEAQAFIGADEFGETDLSFSIGGGPEVVVYCDESLQASRADGERGRADRPTAESADGEVCRRPTPKDVSSKTPARDYAVGDTIGGRFEVEEVLGSGGFSKVYRVRDVVEGEERALKLFDNAAGYDAVRREIGALRKVHHPNVVKVIWADRTDQGEWYLIMEYVEGELLADYATGKKHLRDREAIDVALDVLDALDRDPPRHRTTRSARPEEARRRDHRRRSTTS